MKRPQSTKVCRMLQTVGQASKVNMIPKWLKELRIVKANATWLPAQSVKVSSSIAIKASTVSPEIIRAIKRQMQESLQQLTMLRIKANKFIAYSAHIACLLYQVFINTEIPSSMFLSDPGRNHTRSDIRYIERCQNCCKLSRSNSHIPFHFHLHCTQVVHSSSTLIGFIDTLYSATDAKEHKKSIRYEVSFFAGICDLSTESVFCSDLIPLYKFGYILQQIHLMSRQYEYIRIKSYKYLSCYQCVTNYKQMS
eukprot:TRINITY_DN1650_c0_g1_i3.p2 TRINITY_DN1650_c0_g1~~TRINITY_DN1650_c0_g1_i3.p2  ORF type:complete len:252 (-),score=-34.99 TRINITY_DN1650_c0_g1_i3:36-791(-)